MGFNSGFKGLKSVIMASSVIGLLQAFTKPRGITEGGLGNGGLCQFYDSMHKVHIAKDFVFIVYRRKITYGLSPLRNGL